jgi:2-(1,2-epoxy-1,2-dihydrophenyl)acetyl-CoA isomerase
MSTTTPSMYESFVNDGETATEQVVHVDHRGDRAIVTLAVPDKLNVLTAPLVLQLKRAFTELAADRAVRSIVLTGTDPGFSVGGDFRMMETAVAHIRDDAGTTDIWRWIRNEFGGVARLIARTDKAFIAAINGPAAGVGLAWALTCDLAIASDRALIVPAFGNIGLIPEVGTSWALTRKLGYQGAFAFFAGGQHLDAQAARDAGLVHEVVPHAELMDVVGTWCDRIAALPPHALQMAKPLLRACADSSWENSLTLEEFAEPSCFTTSAFATSVGSMLHRGDNLRVIP